jgi:hypothetical protein
MSIRSARALAYVVVLWLAVVAAGQAADAQIKTMLSDPARYDGQPVTLTGAVSRLDPRVSRRGNPYYTFMLDDGSGRLTVFSFGRAPCAAPARVTVDGEFRHVKTVGTHTFHDQVDARRVVCR